MAGFNLHCLKVKHGISGKPVDVWLDDEKLKGVRGIILNLSVNEVQTAWIELSLSRADVDLKDTAVFTEKTE